MITRSWCDRPCPWQDPCLVSGRQQAHDACHLHHKDWLTGNALATSLQQLHSSGIKCLASMQQACGLSSQRLIVMAAVMATLAAAMVDPHS